MAGRPRAEAPAWLLTANASGLRHLRHGREVLGALEALAALPGLGPAERRALADEAGRLRARIDALSAAVKAYRDFLERERTRHRGRRRVAALLAERPALGDAALRAELERGLDEVAEPRRQALRAPVQAAVAALRQGLRELEDRVGEVLAARDPALPGLVQAALFPPLSPDGSRVADDGDPHDDAAG